MKYTVLIPAAGTGSRLGKVTKYLNKSLVSVGTKPVLARVIEMFPDDAKIVLAVGYKADLMKEFITLAYPHRQIEIVEISLYEGKGSGLGFTLLACEELLQEPFVFCSCDTLVTENIPEPDHNWMGFGARDQITQYRTLQTKNGYVSRILEKEEAEEHCKPYIGLAGIYDYTSFWKAMKAGQDVAITQGEAFGFKGLLAEHIDVASHPFTWFDTGIPKELENTRKFFQKKNDPNILEKENEAIWFMNDMVIKYSDSINFIQDRVKRAKGLGGYIPQIVGKTEHMYAYAYEQGEVLSKAVTLPRFAKLLEWSKVFWKKKELCPQEREQFNEDCMKFYRDKTYERVQLFYQKFQKEDGTESINGLGMPTLQSMLDQLDWDYVAEGAAVRFHGDFHFENILYDEERDRFVFLDWRQNFGSSMEIGDIYYDFAKLLHGLIVCHELIAQDRYDVDWEEDRISFTLYRKQILVECENCFYQWLKDHGYDVHKVKLLTALIYLNIAALHHYPYSLMLYGLGKEMLYQIIREGRHAD